ncbi:MAG: hypothetical protein HY053_01740 [Proteobacteria bacterium]|nr:hypothetical protein [Pseudomonadota bacterium]
MSEQEISVAAVRYAAAMLAMAWKPDGERETLDMTLMLGNDANRIGVAEFEAALRNVVGDVNGSGNVIFIRPDPKLRPRALQISMSSALLSSARARLSLPA